MKYERRSKTNVLVSFSSLVYFPSEIMVPVNHWILIIFCSSAPEGYYCPYIIITFNVQAMSILLVHAVRVSLFELKRYDDVLKTAL